MRRSMISVLAVGSVCVGQDRLVFEDEFDVLNTSVWERMVGDGTQYGIPGWGNNELQYYTGRAQNVRAENGRLVIEARRENFGGKSYTSARLRTLNRAEFRYGRIAASLRLPSTTGIWPAFWMLPTGSPYGGWAASGEIDIMESVGAADRIYGTLHFGGEWPGNTSAGVQIADGRDFSAGFHTYETRWFPDRIEWYLDGVRYGRIMSGQWFSSSAAAGGSGSAPFDQDFHLLLNVAVGGNFPGNPDGSSVFPQRMEVDWVRVWEHASFLAPFRDVPASVPGRVEMEDYDLGGPGIGYVDSDAGNRGNTYRRFEDVDLELRGATGGFHLAYLRAGEWTSYTVDVATASARTRFLVTAEVASQRNGGRFRLELGGEDISGVVVAPGTGGWQTFTMVPFEVELPRGVQTLRFVNLGTDADEFNIDSLTFTELGPVCVADLTGDGMLDIFDVLRFFDLFATGNPGADFEAGGGLNIFDILAFFEAFGAGCV